MRELVGLGVPVLPRVLELVVERVRERRALVEVAPV